MKVRFAKVHGAGNDFVVFAHPEQPDEYFSRIAPRVCNRRKGIGADGVLLVKKDEISDFRMVYFNADGSRASFCGNGARALVLYTYVEGISPSPMTFVSDVGEHKGIVADGKPSVSLPDPSDIELNLDIKGLPSPLHFVNSGVPHTVRFVEDIKAVDVDNLGRKIRSHTRFSPAGTNANFVQVHHDDCVYVRTYERGVEAETLACGTGAVAVAAVLNRLKGFPSPVNLSFPGGGLVVSFDESGSGITNVMLGGETGIVFRGEIDVS
ncbi:diaminopimelate epimerase [candidate division WOR-3 bacterium]|uniref:Diaminopimelate epimerase n=1 Tax=candidate division WOR-3 bacterium TaxID=2052148 RepID=A0A9D5K9B1_UNCW3|nr:diaminopimelate epimerase [candidate division WOR-3 bacterium]MBD3364762.1 diaminopimelate epimerase [candidate division WOR-3 bacterium]